MKDLIRFGDLTVEIEGSDLAVTYTFKGVVDENFRQKDLPRIKAPTINLVLEGINHFNSCGIREWVYLVKDMSALGKLIFKRCSVAMVDQINMVPDSIRGAEIESFFAPYACNDHGETTRLIELKDLQGYDVNHHAPEKNCEHCGKQLEFDALPGSYFLFVASGMQKAS